MTMHIFGDSFADPNFNTRACDEPWYALLGKHSNVINHGSAGSGPHSLIRSFGQGKYRRGDKFIFILSHPHRLDLSAVMGHDPEYNRYAAQFKYNEQTRELLIQKSETESEAHKEVDEYYYENREGFNLIYKSFHHVWPFMTGMYAAYLKEWVARFGMRAVIMTVGCLDQTYPEMDMLDFQQMEHIDRFVVKSSPVCEVMTYGLHRVMAEEFIRVSEIPYGKEKRRNHLSKVNHLILYQKLYDYFYNFKNPVWAFEKNFYNPEEDNYGPI